MRLRQLGIRLETYETVFFMEDRFVKGGVLQ